MAAALLLTPIHLLPQTGLSQLVPALSAYAFDTGQPKKLELQKELQEISDLALSPDGRLFAHNDERGVIYQLDRATGRIVKRFSLGSPPISGDFEDLAIVDSFFYLVTSSGNIHEFREGLDGGHVRFTVYRTGLQEQNDIEGLSYDYASRSLLLACKGSPGKGLPNSRAVYSFSLINKRLDKKPRFIISLVELRKRFGLREFRPSALERNPSTGTYLLLSSRQQSILEISQSGEILAAVSLPKHIHSQPEGIAVSVEGTIYISNEGSSRGTILIYTRN